jgi:hypothetical protein
MLPVPFLSYVKEYINHQKDVWSSIAKRQMNSRDRESTCRGSLLQGTRVSFLLIWQTMQHTWVPLALLGCLVSSVLLSGSCRYDTIFSVNFPVSCCINTASWRMFSKWYAAESWRCAVTTRVHWFKSSQLRPMETDTLILLMKVIRNVWICGADRALADYAAVWRGWWRTVGW